ncbi:XPG N-terminal and XPG I domain containing protein [Aphelenchoides besseyi]|nr:XPG N-terminal and XPG I domain containing protein [Aphelenchoides besseyi]
MGVKGLLKYVEDACSPGHIKEFENQRVAIDVSCFLHRGLMGCIEDIANKKPTDFCIKYIERQLGVFFHYNCKVTLVFDGNSLPAKEVWRNEMSDEINASRRERRESNQRLGDTLMFYGNKTEAYKVMRQGIGVPKEITRAAIDYFKVNPKVEIIVSPYEADAQLAYLMHKNIVDFVVTQDSDLIVYGCSKICFKFESCGDCIVYDKEKLKKSYSLPFVRNFTWTKFRRMCILQGCDYLDKGLRGIGLKKAEKYFLVTNNDDPNHFLKRIPSFFNLKNVTVDQTLIDNFINAEKTFLHQVVYDPVLKIQLPLTPYPDTTVDDYLKFSERIYKISNDDYWFAGLICDPKEAPLLAKGGEAPVVYRNKVPLSRSFTFNSNTPTTSSTTPKSTITKIPTVTPIGLKWPPPKENRYPPIQIPKPTQKVQPIEIPLPLKRTCPSISLPIQPKRTRVNLDDRGAVILKNTTAEEKKFIKSVASFKNGMLLKTGVQKKGELKPKTLEFASYQINVPPPRKEFAEIVNKTA